MSHGDEHFAAVYTDLEVYSIDEAWLDLTGIDTVELDSYGESCGDDCQAHGHTSFNGDSPQRCSQSWQIKGKKRKSQVASLILVKLKS